MLTENEARRLGDAIQSWLDFQILCNRDVLLSEAYLAQPVGEFLVSHHNGGIESERNHPSVPDPNRGRPRQIDYVLTSKDEKDLVSALEAKWVPENRPISRQRILNDIMRLERLRNDSGRAAYRYFLVAGRSQYFDDHFLDLDYNTKESGRENFIESILPTDEEEKHVRIDEAPEGLKSSVSNYIEKYSKGDERVLPPKSYKATLITDKSDEKSRVMLWRIKSVRRRSEIEITV
jgi:hypothetical protein